MTHLRRFLAIQALMLWQGGFLFYAAFVVPVGTRVLGSAEGQGAITARVTESLNLVGSAALALLLWELSAAWSGPRRHLRAACWLLMALGQAALFHLHRELAGLMDSARLHVANREAFYPMHQAYLIISTMQWVLAVIFAWQMLRTWNQKMN